MNPYSTLTLVLPSSRGRRYIVLDPPLEKEGIYYLK